MIEVSIENILLLLWAGLATGSWLNARDEVRSLKRLLTIFIEDKDARQQIVSAHEKFMRERNNA